MTVFDTLMERTGPRIFDKRRNAGTGQGFEFWRISKRRPSTPSSPSSRRTQRRKGASRFRSRAQRWTVGRLKEESCHVQWTTSGWLPFGSSCQRASCGDAGVPQELPSGTHVRTTPGGRSAQRVSITRGFTPDQFSPWTLPAGQLLRHCSVPSSTQAVRNLRLCTPCHVLQCHLCICVHFRRVSSKTVLSHFTPHRVAPISTLRTHSTLVAEQVTPHFVDSRVTASTRRTAEEASLPASGSGRKRRDLLATE